MISREYRLGLRIDGWELIIDMYEEKQRTKY
jgi:hypothetical protein